MKQGEVCHVFYSVFMLEHVGVSVHEKGVEANPNWQDGCKSCVADFPAYPWHPNHHCLDIKVSERQYCSRS